MYVTKNKLPQFVLVDDGNNDSTFPTSFCVFLGMKLDLFCLHA